MIFTKLRSTFKAHKNEKNTSKQCSERMRMLAVE